MQVGGRDGGVGSVCIGMGKREGVMWGAREDRGRDGELLETPFKVGGANVTPLQRARHVGLKEPPV